MIHGVGPVESQLVVDPAAFLFTAVLRAVLGWARARCGSIWSCVVLHNLWTVLAVAVATVL